MLQQKTIDELRSMFAETSGVNPRVISVRPLGTDGDFCAAVVGLVRDPKADQITLDTTADHLRTRYTLKV